MAFSKPRVTNFCSVYEDTLKKHNISPTRIYNVNYSNLSTFQKKQKLFAQTGRQQVGLLTSADRGIHVTLVFCKNLYGHRIPSALIFPLQNLGGKKAH
jgi:hypothetical protein